MTGRPQRRPHDAPSAGLDGADDVQVAPPLQERDQAAHEPVIEALFFHLLEDVVQLAQLLAGVVAEDADQVPGQLEVIAFGQDEQGRNFVAPDAGDQQIAREHYASCLLRDEPSSIVPSETIS